MTRLGRWSRPWKPAAAEPSTAAADLESESRVSGRLRVFLGGDVVDIFTGTDFHVENV